MRGRRPDNDFLDPRVAVAIVAGILLVVIAILGLAFYDCTLHHLTLGY